MFRRSSIIIAASLALLSTLDSAKCFAAAAPAQSREDLERPRFLKKEIKRFIFSNTTTSRGGPPGEASTSDLEALYDALTSSSSLDLGAEATSTSATPTITTTPSVPSSDDGQSSSSDVSASSSVDSDRDREALLALNPSPTTDAVSSAPPTSSSPHDSEGTITQSSLVPGGESIEATGSSQSPPSSDLAQATSSSAVEQPGVGVTSQFGSTVQPDTSPSPSSASLPNSHESPEDVIHKGSLNSVTTAAGDLQSSTVTIAGAGSSAGLPAGNSVESDSGGEATSGTPGPNTKTDNEASANTNTKVNEVVPTTLGSGAGAATTQAAQPASSPYAPQSVAVPATAIDSGSGTVHDTTGSADTQPTVTPGSGAGPTSEQGGLLGLSASVVLQPNPVHAISQVGPSPPQTTLADGQVVPNTSPASVPSPGGDHTSPTPNAGPTEAPTVLNPSLAAAASKLNDIPASVENPSATLSGAPPLVYNPSLAAAASVVGALPVSVQNPEKQVSLGGSPNSASPGVPGASDTPGSPPNTAASPNSASPGAPGASNSPGSPPNSASPNSPNSASARAAGAAESAGPQPNSASPLVPGGSNSPGVPAAATGSPIGVSGSPYASATPESGIAGYSTQSNGNVVPISAAAGPGSTVSNGQIVPVATGHEASAQSPGPQDTGAVAASNAAQSAAAVASSNSIQSAAAVASSNSVQSAAAVAAGATQNNPPPGPTATPVVPQNQQFSGKGPYSQSPVGYDTSTTQPIPTSILHGPSSTPSATQGHLFGPSSLPSNVPQILYQNGGPGSQPPNTRLINIAFRFALNYLFVYNHTVSQQQIFHYIPLGICYGLEIEVEQVTMQSLRAWDTYEDVGYITTLALAWVPEGLVDNLGFLVSTSVSRFYRNPDNSTAFLLSMINDAIPITGSNNTDGASTPFGNIPTDTSSAKTAGAPIGGDIGNSEHVRASSVGIGVGVACGAAAYGAAMFFVARRYKRRRQSHLRSPSMLSSPVMSHAGPDAGAGAALMSGAMGERSASPYYDNDGRAGSRGSGRSGSSRHQISAPVMAENSLGWN